MIFLFPAKVGKSLFPGPPGGVGQDWALELCAHSPCRPPRRARRTERSSAGADSPSPTGLLPGPGREPREFTVGQCPEGSKDGQPVTMSLGELTLRQGSEMVACWKLAGLIKSSRGQSL